MREYPMYAVLSAPSTFLYLILFWLFFFIISLLTHQLIYDSLMPLDSSPLAVSSNQSLSRLFSKTIE